MLDLTRRDWLRSATLGSAVVLTTGCGTVLYPERIGQPRGDFDNIDWGVVGMNTIGLVFFFVPGVLAFAIDFYNGTMFYPPAYVDHETPVELQTAAITADQPTREAIEHLLKEKTGRQVDLQQHECLSCRISSIRHFWTTAAAANANA